MWHHHQSSYKSHYSLQTKCPKFKSDTTIFRMSVRNAGLFPCALHSGTKESGLSSGCVPVLCPLAKRFQWVLKTVSKAWRIVVGGIPALDWHQILRVSCFWAWACSSKIVLWLKTWPCPMVSSRVCVCKTCCCCTAWIWICFSCWICFPLFQIRHNRIVIHYLRVRGLCWS